MASKGLLMLCAAFISGAWMSGCRQSVALSPLASIPRTGLVYTPRRMPLSPGTLGPLSPANRFRYPANPVLMANPWEPKVPARAWKYIVIHHTASARGSVESIDQIHRNRTDKNGNRWLGIGYHFVIGNGNGMPDGSIEPTFRWWQQLHGAHAGADDYNQKGIGIALVGNFEEGPPSAAQLAAIKSLVATLKGNYRITADNVIGHRDVKATACPGKFFPMAQVSQSLFGPSFGDRRGHQTPARLTAFNGSRKP